ncbi:hypothetical protein R1flu_002308 [Riccia fluitans]|uniref:Uncharacterized protein n=1 Tax=Riccia fluitans TaxID=41844 RepID=A0ABD1Y5Q4_9MARC
MPEPSAHNQPPSTERTTVDKVTVFEDVGSLVIKVAHFYFRKVRTLPSPLGSSISYIEDTLSPWLQPLVTSVEEEGLHLLSLVDQKISSATDAALRPLKPLVSVFVIPLQIVLSELDPVKLESNLEKLRRRGIIGCTADAWVKYEPVVRKKSQGVYKLVRKIPGSSLAVYVCHDIGSPVVSAISQWLVDHSEKKGKLVTSSGGDFSPIESPPAERDIESAEDVAAVQQHAKEHATELPTDYQKPPTDVQKHAQEHATERQEVSWKQPTDVQVHAKEQAAECQDDYQKQPIASETISLRPEEKSVASTAEVTAGSTSEISLPTAEDEKEVGVAVDDHKAPDLHTTQPQQDPEEHDEILDLFDTWGLGLQAISPKGLDNLRSLSVQDRSVRTTPPKPKPKSTSFRF